MNHHELQIFSSVKKTKHLQKGEADAQYLLEEIQCLWKISVLQSQPGYEIDVEIILSYEITNFPSLLQTKKMAPSSQGIKQSFRLFSSKGYV